MRILITNDDGIHAEGLRILEDIARTLSDDVIVVAPEIDQSGVAHSLSLNDPLRLRHIGAQHYAVKGTPTDCVLMGVHTICKDKKPDLILSGVNHGHNLAEDVTYSGTIAGAMEGTLLGIKSIALSQGYAAGAREAIDWSIALDMAPQIIRTLLDEGIPPEILVNVNFPACRLEDVKGIRVSVQGRRDFNLAALEQRFDGRGKPYYWIGFARSKSEPANGTDLQAIEQNYVSITPLRLDLTDEPTLTAYARVFS
jgi:5'-nucleotidase